MLASHEILASLLADFRMSFPDTEALSAEFDVDEKERRMIRNTLRENPDSRSLDEVTRYHEEG